MNKLFVRVGQSPSDGTKLLVNLDHKTFLEIEWRMADELAKALIATARKCEELEKGASIARDAGLLLRAGIPIGLSDHPVIRDEARKIAAHEREFRRALPGGIRSREEFGTPNIIRGAAPTERKQ